jgi:hypothetical protein
MHYWIDPQDFIQPDNSIKIDSLASETIIRDGGRLGRAHVRMVQKRQKDREMQQMTTKVSAGALLSQLHMNLEKHEKDYAEALEGWKRKMRERLDKLALQLDDEDFNLQKLHELRRPQTHKDDYEPQYR